uniref:Uncharacterized protein n=1 Tax=Monodon monoceros TaxID=40151 RepID=A0A8C6ASS4_MONMO
MAYLWAFYPVPLIYSVFVPFEVGEPDSSSSVFLPQDCFGYLGSFVSPYFIICFFYFSCFCEKCYGYFDQHCTESVDFFGSMDILTISFQSMSMVYLSIYLCHLNFLSSLC